MSQTLDNEFSKWLEYEIQRHLEDMGLLPLLKKQKAAAHA